MAKPSRPYTTLLLKTRSTPHDAYTSLPSATFLPVLTHTLLPAAAAHLTTLLTAPLPSPLSLAYTYGGLILTSQRAVEALVSVLAQLGARPDYASLKENLALWHGVVYVVGAATGKAARGALADWVPDVRVEGEESGNGAALARLILEGYQRGNKEGEKCADGGGSTITKEGMQMQKQHKLEESGATVDAEEDVRILQALGTAAMGQRKPLLFLVGEQRRDIIPKTLQGEGLKVEDRIRVDEVVVYQTEERAEFEGEFREELGRTENEDMRWVVVFSPTGCGAMLRVLGWLGEDGRYEKRRRDAGKGCVRGIKVASIGPTTRDLLRDNFGFDVEVCAEQPSVEGVQRGIEAYLNENNQA